MVATLRLVEPTRGSGDDGAHFNLRLLASLGRCLRDEHGERAVADVAAQGGVRPEDFQRSSVWVSAQQFEAMLRAALEILGDDDALRRACAYRMTDAYGPLRFVVRAASPALIFRQAAKHFGVISRVSSIAVEAPSRTRLRVRYTTRVREGRLACLSRQAQMAAAPALWGLPPAHLAETGCVARGDEACVYDLRLHDRSRLLPVLVAGLAGFALGLGIGTIGGELPAWTLGVPTALAAYALETRRALRSNLRVEEQFSEELRRIAHEEAEARAEIVALQDRQRQWVTAVERELEERSASVAAMVEGMQKLGHEQSATMRGVTHDLNNPLQVISVGVMWIRNKGPDPELLQDMDDAVRRMSALIGRVVAQFNSEGRAPVASEVELEIAEVTDSLRRRASALVLGRDIRVSVFRTREAPDGIRCDRLMFDRVMDNLLTNAAKYTERGSIVVEVGGTPEGLTVKVSDTGLGIAAEELPRIFSVNEPPRERRGTRGHGVGLATTVQVLARMGGRLDVLSRPGVGTTFWAHFPLSPATRPENVAPAPESVVTIRKHVGNE